MKFRFHSFYSICLMTWVLCTKSSANVEQFNKNVSNGGCNLFEGSWVLDDSYPLYDSVTCPFIVEEFDCQKNKRPDLEYQKYKWKPNDCVLPRFNGQDFLTKFKGKKILFVGDSLSFNQWLSLSCMLHAAVPQTEYTIKQFSSFSIPEYDILISLDTNRFLVDIETEGNNTILDLDSVKKGATKWKGYDVLIFNTFHWWLHTGALQNWNFLRVEGKLIKDMDRVDAFKLALTTWTKWVDVNIDPNVTKVFFQGISPTHYNAAEWKDVKSKSCKGQTKPISGSIYPGGRFLVEDSVKEILRTVSTKVTLLDITTLSQLRVDGHPSIYGTHGSGSDCSHWCLSGVPDTWNEILYTLMINK